MSEYILPSNINVTPEREYSVSGDVNRAERTPGAVAVSEVYGGGQVLEEASETSSGTSTTNSVPSPSELGTKLFRLVGFSKIRSLLQPLHSFFKDKYAEIEEFRVYDGEEAALCYPVIKCSPAARDNPYRRYRLNRKASMRSYKKVRKLVDNRRWNDFCIADLTVTMPRDISKFLVGQGKNGRLMAWRLFKGFWSEDLPAVIDQDIELACHANLHLWSSEVPTEPHNHIHCLIPNYGLTESKTEVDEEGNPAMEWSKWKWHRQRGGRVVPFSEQQLEDLRELWKARLRRFCKRHGLKEISTDVNIYTHYVDEWSRFLHKLIYNGRHWSENYAEYSNENLECSDPPEWLLGYENRARVFGWWSNIKNFVVTDEEIEKISPYTGEQMEYMGGYTLYQINNKSEGNIGYVDFVKGQPVEGFLTDEDKEWLKGVIYKSSYTLMCERMAKEYSDIDPDTT